MAADRIAGGITESVRLVDRCLHEASYCGYNAASYTPIRVARFVRSRLTVGPNGHPDDSPSRPHDLLLNQIRRLDRHPAGNNAPTAPLTAVVAMTHCLLVANPRSYHLLAGHLGAAP